MYRDGGGSARGGESRGRKDKDTERMQKRSRKGRKTRRQRRKVMAAEWKWLDGPPQAAFLYSYNVVLCVQSGAPDG